MNQLSYPGYNPNQHKPLFFVSDKRNYSDHLAQTLSTILNKDFQVDNGQKGRRLFRSSTQKNIEASKGLIYLQTAALSSARVAMSPGEYRLCAPCILMFIEHCWVWLLNRPSCT